jgi:hypothetical protein
LNLALLIDRQDNGIVGRIDVEPDDFSCSLAANCESLDSLNWRAPGAVAGHKQAISAAPS